MSQTEILVSCDARCGDQKKPDPYSYSISQTAQDVARLELREDLFTVEESLAQFREWIRKSPDVRNVQTDSNFLLRFLRAKKYSLPMAQQTLLKYLNLKKKYPNASSNLDYTQPKILDLIESGYLFVSPIRDSLGRRVIIGIGSKLDPHKYTYEDHFKVHMLTYETLLFDEETQIMGLTYFGDTKEVSVSHLTLWSPTEFGRVIKWGEQSIPARHKEVHFINVPSALKYVYEFFLSKLSNKMKSRLTIHATSSEAAAAMGNNCLPKEYGGTIPMADMIASWKKELSAKRDKVLQLDQMEILNPNAIISRRNNKVNKPNHLGDTVIPGSFRKLEVD